MGDARLVNVNVGVLGHVDSGKTSLVRSLSTHLSTAALDKNPQSRARGITLDLGFSSFTMPFANDETTKAQITLVDCPGHASLIKTVIGGAHIIDMALLVIDAVKGIQVQTIESTVLAEIATPHVLVVLNKIDLFPADTRATQIQAMTKTVREFLASSLTLADAPIVAVASGDAEGTRDPIGIPELLACMQERLQIPKRSPDGPLCYAIDHCFPLRGKGTVVTGTVLSGSVQVNDTIALPMLGVEKKVKSLQMFHTNVERAIQGDRVGIRLHGLDADAIERGLAISPKSLSFSSNLVIRVNQVRFFSLACDSGAKLHVTVGHATVLAKATFFHALNAAPESAFNPCDEYMYLPSLAPWQETKHVGVFVLLELERDLLCPPRSQVVCSRLDSDKQECRIAFHGALEATIEQVSTLSIGKIKQRLGVIDKVMEEDGMVVIKDLFRKETNVDVFRGLRIQNTRTGDVGELDARFGKTGKCRARFDRPIRGVAGDPIVLRFVKTLFQDKKQRHHLRQSDLIYTQPTTFESSATEKKADEVDEKKSEPVQEAPTPRREGLVERLKGETAPNGSNPSVIATGLFATADEAMAFIGIEVVTAADEVGHIEALFGKAGKVRVTFEIGTMAQIGDSLYLVG
ncbi:unnamed protein product [Aphanomyces euteiches]